jgi:hypothetical protein
MTRRPDFIVLGQGKAGTSLIYRVLEANPAIGLSTPKELHYFSSRFEEGLGPDWYDSHFAHLDPQIPRVGEVSPSYLDPEALPRLIDLLGTQIKVIFVLRRPVERAYARYIQNISAQQKRGDFQHSMGHFGARLAEVEAAIAQCFAAFGRSNVLVLSYEDDIVPFRFEHRVLDFLGLPSADFSAPYRDAPPVNPGVMPRYIYGGRKGISVHFDGAEYRIPARHLAFCAQARNSRVFPDITGRQALRAFTEQSTWTPEVSAADHQALTDRHVLPLAARLEAAYGLDLSAWRAPAGRIAYLPGPPPQSLRIGQNSP